MMANEKLTKEGIEYIIGRLLKNAQETVGEWEKDKSNLGGKTACIMQK